MESEIEIWLLVRGVVTPAQWRDLQRGDETGFDVLERLFRDRLNARDVIITRIDLPDPHA